MTVPGALSPLSSCDPDVNQILIPKYFNISAIACMLYVTGIILSIKTLLNMIVWVEAAAYVEFAEDPAGAEGSPKMGRRDDKLAT